MNGADGKSIQIALGPNSLVEYRCHNMTMEAFAAALRTMLGASLGPNPIVDQTGLKGAWNFGLKYTFVNGLITAHNRINVPDAIEKQLGLKLEEQPLPVSVLIVDSVEEKPDPNPPGVSAALPPVVAPTEFEVADIKPSDPETRGASFRTLPGGRVVSSNLPVSFLISQAFPGLSKDRIIGMPGVAEIQRFDVNAKTAASLGTNPDDETLAPLILSLLKDRFAFQYHTEERTLPAYGLLANKPKMKKADPASRTHCIRSNDPVGTPPGTSILNCQNITMAQFVEQLRGMGQGLKMAPVDATQLEGGWDFILTWNQRTGMNTAPARTAEGSDVATSADPGGGYTIFEAMEKQLGLKLEMQKHPIPVIVIDHLDPKPTDN
jgi:uncharacterized protein (TIGR03435 family)